MTSKELKKPTHYVLHRNPSYHGEFQSVNPNLVLKSKLTSIPTSSQLLSWWSPSQPIRVFDILQLLKISHALNRCLSQKIGQEPFDLHLPSRQKHFVEMLTNINPLINVGNLIIASPNYQILNVLRALVGHSQLKFEDFLSLGGGEPPNPPHYPSKTPKGPPQEQSKEEILESPTIMVGVNVDQPNN
jgi:hypothetical protein